MSGSNEVDGFVSAVADFVANYTRVRSINEIVPRSLEEYIKIMRQKRKELSEKEEEEFMKVGSRLWNKIKNDEPLGLITLDEDNTFHIDDQAIKLSNDKVVKVVEEFIDFIVAVGNFPAFLREMSLVYLVAQFEQFLEKILQHTYDKRPEILKTTKKSISYEELLSYPNIDQIKEIIVQKETRSKINEGIDEIKEYLKDMFGLDLSGQKDWQKFREYFYRRNMIIHNNGFPNEIYRKKTGYTGKQEKLSVEIEYLLESLDNFLAYSQLIGKFFKSKFS